MTEVDNDFFRLWVFIFNSVNVMPKIGFVGWRGGRGRFSWKPISMKHAKVHKLELMHEKTTTLLCEGALCVVRVDERACEGLMLGMQTGRTPFQLLRHFNICRIYCSSCAVWVFVLDSVVLAEQTGR